MVHVLTTEESKHACPHTHTRTQGPTHANPYPLSQECGSEATHKLAYLSTVLWRSRSTTIRPHAASTQNTNTKPIRVSVTPMWPDLTARITFRGIDMLSHQHIRAIERIGSRLSLNESSQLCYRTLWAHQQTMGIADHSISTVPLGSRDSSSTSSYTFFHNPPLISLLPSSLLSTFRPNTS